MFQSPVLVPVSFTECKTDVVNGEKNLILLSIENKSDRNVTLLSMSGSVHHPDTNALVKNVRSGLICLGVIGQPFLVSLLPFLMASYLLRASSSSFRSPSTASKLYHIVDIVTFD